MADPSSGITFRTIQEAMPEYHISNSLLDGLLTALPPPPPGASAAWCRERLGLVIDEVAARVPMDAAQGHLAAQCVLAAFLAEDMSARLRTPGLTMMERRQVNGTADKLMCTVARMERALERRQMRVMPFRDVGAAAGFDLDALEGVWRRGMLGLAATDPRVADEASAMQLPTAPEAAVVLDPVKREPMGPEPDGPEPDGHEPDGHEPDGPEPAESEPDGPEPAEPEAGLVAMSVSARAGDAAAAGHTGRGPGAAVSAGTSDGHDRRGRAGVTLEQGDGWSLEVWPAGAGASVVAGLGARDALTDTGAKSGAATVERAAKGRPGSPGTA